MCLAKLYMPSRGCPDCDIQFQCMLDEAHEILDKYGHTHKIVLVRLWLSFMMSNCEVVTFPLVSLVKRGA